MGQTWNKFVLLIWKNHKQQIRNPIQTIFEIFAPIFFAVILLLLRYLLPISQHDEISFAPFEVSPPLISNTFSNVVWSPENPILYSIVDNAVANMNAKNNATMIKHRSFQNSLDLNLYLSNEVNMISTLAAVEFQDNFRSIEHLSVGSQINITLRFPAELRATLHKYDTWRTKYKYAGNEPGPREETLNDGGLPSYNREGFLLLQQELSFSIIKQLKIMLNQTEPVFPKIYLQRFPSPPWTGDKLMKQIWHSVGIIFLLAYIYTALSIVKTVTYEKENQLKEVMKIMGLPNWLHWTVWTLKFFISLSITSVLMTLILTTDWNPSSNLRILPKSDPLVIFVFFICFSCATMSFCFAVSSCFSSANTSATFTGLLWFLMFVPYYFIDKFYTYYNFSEKLATCLCSNTAMAYGFRLILTAETDGTGIQWTDVMKYSSGAPSMGYIMMMLIVDSILYFIISLYVGAVFPGRYGVPEKWYYPFSYTYWFGAEYAKGSCATQNLVVNDCFEVEPHHLEHGIIIKNISKQYCKNKFAVNGLSLNIFQDQITVVLGHNGAGKTTTMSMLIGMFPPTYGTAIVGGYDIRKDIVGVRRNLGLCPQHNVLFDELTVAEHIYFYSRLKGMENDKSYQEATKYITALDLAAKADARVSTLSGGMKRKLSVAVAFCGKSKVVILDEPTAGMDPSARRLVWTLLQTEKKGRTIVLSTHFMDEADYLGDRIGIMAKGRLQCCGSSFFLKKKYGAGYHLIIEKSKTCVVDKVTSLLNKYIPVLKVGSNIGSELVYILNEEFSSIFEPMFKELEDHSKELGINTYGISLTSLEEVFMKVGTETFASYKPSDTMEDHVRETRELEKSSQANVPMYNNLLTGWDLWINQIQAMFMKRILSVWRCCNLLVIQILIPIVFVIFIMIIIVISGGYNNLPKIAISLPFYTDTITLVSLNRNNSYWKSYMDILAKEETEVLNWEDTDLNTKIQEAMFDDSWKVRYHYIVGATMHENQTLTGWFNNIPYHSASLALQLIQNAILHREVSASFTLMFFNHPLPYSFINTKMVSLLSGDSDDVSLVLNISFSMAFVSAFYVLFYIKERANNAKHLQFISGVNVMSFWIPAITIDFLTMTLTSICLVCTIAMFQITNFSTVAELGRLFSLHLAFGIGMLPVMYLSSFLFNNPSTGFAKMTFFNIFSGIAAYLVVGIITTSEHVALQHIGDILNWILIIFPHYSLSDGISVVTQVNAINSICNSVIEKCVEMKAPFSDELIEQKCKILLCIIEKRCCNTVTNYYTWASTGILKNILSFLVVGGISFFFLICIEYKIFRSIHCGALKRLSYIKTAVGINHLVDDDVLLEKEKVENLTQNELRRAGVVLQNVTKYFGNTAAVRDVSFVINRYECFGLLGVNGAGKTTTFKMMTGDIRMTHGKAWVCGLNINSEIKSVQKIIGYCPQFDALLDDLTARETLIVFGLIRGIPKSRMKIIAEELAQDFDFYQHLDKKVKELSGGNKRKLSTSLALVGDPQVLYLDEPTTGMDPATKRHLWNCICKVRDNGKCIVLTSHSMEECQALCTRLAIMVNGQLMCLGSTQHLKSKFSNTFTFTIKVNRSEPECSTEAVENYVEKHFQNASLRERHKDLLLYSISGENQRWSEMFGIMENAKRTLHIEDYSLGQCSLEQVFLRLTKYQVED